MWLRAKLPSPLQTLEIRGSGGTFAPLPDLISGPFSNCIPVSQTLMAILNILEYPDPRLRTIATPVEVVDDSIRQLVDDMFETMYAAPGIGLAATQVNVHKRVVVMDLSEDKSEPRVFINPEFEPLTDEMDQYQEGCLSVPGFYENVDRPQKVKIRALDRDGQPYELIAEGLLAVCIQHECDHLNGKLFVDYLSQLKRDRIKKKLEKQHRLQQA
jgi:peptide deformylase